MVKALALRTLLLIMAMVGLVGCPLPPETVEFVDIDRYRGLWYQVAGYPFFATDDLVGVTAEYDLLENGNVSVINRGFVGDFDGPEDVIFGEARIVDVNTNAKLAVRFPEILGGIFEGEYWIIRLDEVDYSYAVVSDSRRGTLYILSRTPVIDEILLEDILVSLSLDGFDIDRVLSFPQQTSNER
jgi:apolipoprotein D and lipocalin family protein